MMSNEEEVSSQEDQPDSIPRAPAFWDTQTSEATTSSHAVENVSNGSSIQFNSDVARRTRTSYSRDTLQVEDHSFQGGRLHTEQGHVQFHINVTQSTPQYDQSIPPRTHSLATPSSNTVQRHQFLRQQALLPERSRSKSSSEISEGQPSPGIATPMGANDLIPADPGPSHLTDANRKVVDAMQTKIAWISSRYETLPRKLERFKRIPGLDSMRKDLSSQGAKFGVNVGTRFGGLLSAVEGTLERSQSSQHMSPVPLYSQHEQGNNMVTSIKARMDRIYHVLVQVDDMSDALDSQQDKLSLTIRQRNHAKEARKPRHNHFQPTNTAVSGRGRVTKKRHNSSTKHGAQHPPEFVLKIVIDSLNEHVDEFSRECKMLQPAKLEFQFKSTPIPEDLKLTKAAAVMLCKALCQACPNKNHVHHVLFGLSTQELCSGADTGDQGVEFNLAFESPGEPETWFVVQSTLKTSGSEEMDVDAHLFDDLVESTAHARPSISEQLKESSYTTAEPNARFCLQYHKQGTDDLAVALKHSDICEHELFYPDQARLNRIRGNGQAISLKQLFEERDQVRQLEPLQKVRIAKLLAEAVLKFYSADWLSCEWDWNNVLIYEIDGFLEPHLRFELRTPEFAGINPQTPSNPRYMGQVIAQLGALLAYFAVGPNHECASYNAVKIHIGSTIYAEIMEACGNMSQVEDSLSEVDVQDRFYTKVVAKLDRLEEQLEEDWAYLF